MPYIFLFTYTRAELNQFISHLEDNIKRGWLTRMHPLWNEGIELAKSLL